MHSSSGTAMSVPGRARGGCSRASGRCPGGPAAPRPRPGPGRSSGLLRRGAGQGQAQAPALLARHRVAHPLAGHGAPAPGAAPGAPFGVQEAQRQRVGVDAQGAEGRATSTAPSSAVAVRASGGAPRRSAPAPGGDEAGVRHLRGPKRRARKMRGPQAADADRAVGGLQGALRHRLLPGGAHLPTRACSSSSTLFAPGHRVLEHVRGGATCPVHTWASPSLSTTKALRMPTAGMSA